MAVLSVEALASRIVEQTVQQGSCLFAGAGVGRRAGLPLWPEYLGHLASVAQDYEPETAVLIRMRVATGHYLEAAELYKECIVIPEGVKSDGLSAPFLSAEGYSPKLLRGLMTLPFTSVVTTNYDRSLHDAYQNLFERSEESGLTLAAPKHVELHDPSMRHAIAWSDFYIARIHGRAEVPQTMVLDRNDYRRTEDDQDYLDLLLHVLKSYRCLFVGYSFLDPAINRVLDVMSKRFPQPYPRLHLALLPSDCNPGLRAELAKYNIELAEYDPRDEHKALWDAIHSAQRDVRTAPRRPPDRSMAIPALKRFVASAYARLKLGKRVEPLREIVVEGIVAQAAVDAGTDGATITELVSVVKKYLSLEDRQLRTLISGAVEGLLVQGVCSQERDRIVARADSHKYYDAVLDSLVEGAVRRLKTREGIDADESVQETVAEVVERLLLVRGWDLGAHFAGGHPSSQFDAWPEIKGQVEAIATGFSAKVSQAVSSAVFDVFRHPEDKEAVLLADLGRIAFGVELVLNHAAWAMRDTLLLAGTVYFDASVLMPAIVPGHPLSPVYADAISTLHKAIAPGGKAARVFVARGFLDEIVAHRERAVQQVYDQGLENLDKLRRHVLMWGADKTNVYVGAYATWRGRTDESISFAQFLEQAAPYGSEETLVKFLEEQGIRTVTLSFSSGEEVDCYNRIRIALRDAYEDAAYAEPFYQTKPKVLIENEARQLSRLILDAQAGRRPLFVTADARLMRLCRGEVLGGCADLMVSGVGFVQLIDLMLGLGPKADKRGLARLMWSVVFADDRTTIRNYLIDLALQHYDDALLRAMWDVVEEISDEAAEAAKSEGVTMFPPREEDRARSAAFLDRFEQNFYASMTEVVRKREQQMRGV